MASTTDAALAASAAARERGNAYFRAGDDTNARLWYTHALTHMRVLALARARGEADTTTDTHVCPSGKVASVAASADAAVTPSAPDDEAADAESRTWTHARVCECVRTHACTCLCNRAASALRQSDYASVLRDTTCALALDPASTKALYRRAQAFHATGRVREGVCDCVAVLKLDKDNAQAAALLRMMQAAGPTGRPAGAAAAAAGSKPGQPGGGAIQSLSFAEALGAVKGATAPLTEPAADAVMRALVKELAPSAEDEAAGSVTAPLPSVRALLSIDARGQRGPAVVWAAMPRSRVRQAAPAILNILSRCHTSASARLAQEWASGTAESTDISYDAVKAMIADDALVSHARSVLATTEEPPALSAHTGSAVHGLCAFAEEVLRTQGDLDTLMVLKLASTSVALALALSRPYMHGRGAKLLAILKRGRDRRYYSSRDDAARDLAADGALKLRVAAFDDTVLRRSRVHLPRDIDAAVRGVSKQIASILIQRPAGTAASASSSDAWAAHAVALGAGVQMLGAAYGETRPRSGLNTGDAAAAGAAAVVQHLIDDGVLTQVYALASESTGGSTAKAVDAVLVRSLSISKSACPAGSIEVGRGKAIAMMNWLLQGGLDALARAFPYRVDADGKTAGGEGITESKSPEEPEGADLPESIWTATDDCARACSLLRAALLVDRDFGLHVAQTPGVLPAVFLAADSAVQAWQASACDVISLLCNDDAGRGVLTGLPDRIVCKSTYAPLLRVRLDVARLLTRLAEASAPTIRSSATLMLAKLTSPAKVFGANTDAAKRSAKEMIETVVGVVRGAVGLPEAPASTAAAKDGKPRTPPFGELLVAAKRRVVADDAAALSAELDTSLMRWIGSAGTAAGSRTGTAGTSGLLAPTASAMASALVSKVDVAACARAVEALAVLATHTKVKPYIVSDAVMTPLMTMAASVAAYLDHARLAAAGRVRASAIPTLPDGTDLRPAAFGLAFVVYSVTVSRTRQLEEKLADMDIDIAQWRELQRLVTPPASATGGAPLPGTTGMGEPEEEDTQEAVAERVRGLLRHDVVAMLGSLADAARAGTVADTKRGTRALPGAKDTAQAGSSVREMVAAALCNMAEFAWARGQLVAFGAVPVLLSLCDDVRAATSDSRAAGADEHVASITSTTAAHAMARIFISVQPSLVPSAQVFDSIPHLLQIIRESPSGLAQFEATLAITNLLGVVPECRSVIVKKGGLQALEYLQFSDNPLHRRAATEALANLATTDEGCALITGDRVGLWLALARAFPRSEQPAESPPGGASAPAPAPAIGPSPPLSASDALDKLKRKHAAAPRIDETPDAATSSAALGALAMALLHRFSPLDDDEDERIGVDMAAVSRDAIRISAVGGVRVCAEVLLGSEDPALLHRALVVLGELARFPEAVGIMLSPLAAVGGAEDEVAGPKLDITTAALTLLCAEAKCPATMAKPAATSAGRKQKAAISKSLPSPVAAAAAACLQRLLSHSWPTVERAVAAASTASKAPAALPDTAARSGKDSAPATPSADSASFEYEAHPVKPSDEFVARARQLVAAAAEDE